MDLSVSSSTRVEETRLAVRRGGRVFLFDLSSFRKLRCFSASSCVLPHLSKTKSREEELPKNCGTEVSANLPPGVSAALSAHLRLLFEANDFVVRDADCFDASIAVYGQRPPCKPCVLVAKLHARGRRGGKGGSLQNVEIEAGRRGFSAECEGSLAEEEFYQVESDPPFVRRFSEAVSVFSVCFSSAGDFVVGANASASASSLRLWTNSPLKPSVAVRIDTSSRGKTSEGVDGLPRVSCTEESKVSVLSSRVQKRLSALYEQFGRELAGYDAPDEHHGRQREVTGSNEGGPSLKDLLKHVSIPSFDASFFSVQLLHAPTRDGRAKVSVTLVSPRHFEVRFGCPLKFQKEESEESSSWIRYLPSASSCGGDSWLTARPLPASCRKSPLLLSVYGAYKAPLCASFDATSALLLQRGWRVGFLHIRGGGEALGEEASDGRGVQKLQSVSDLQDALAFLVASGIASPEKTVVKAESAGGIVAAWLFLISQMPEWMRRQNPLLSEDEPWVKAVHLDRCFLDVRTATTNLKLPLAALEREEWLATERDECGAEDIEKERSEADVSLWSSSRSAAAEALASDAHALVSGYCAFEHLLQLKETDSLPSPLPKLLISCDIEDTRAPASRASLFASRLSRLWQSSSASSVFGRSPVFLRILEESAGHSGPLTWKAQTRKAAEEACFFEGSLRCPSH